MRRASQGAVPGGYMKFTERQERMVGRFLRESSYIVKNLSPTAQTQTLLQVRQRLFTELLYFQRESVDDDDLSVMLERLRVSPTGWQKPPDRPENYLVADRDTAAPVDTSIHTPSTSSLPSTAGSVSLPAGPLPVEEGRLLGVCVAVSERMAFTPLHVRAAFVMTGLTTGPFALIIYLGLYFEMCFAEQEPGPRHLAPGQLVKAVGRTAAPLTVLYAAAAAILILLDVLYERLVSVPAGLGVWQRFADYHASLFLGSLLVLVPIAVLSALPVPLQLHAGIRRCLHAGLSIYAVVLCIGIASHLTGLLLGIARGYNG